MKRQQLTYGNEADLKSLTTWNITLRRNPSATKKKGVIEEPKQSHASPVKSQTLRKLNNVNINNHQTLKIDVKLQSLHPTISRPQKKEKLPSQINSSTDSQKTRNRPTERENI